MNQPTLFADCKRERPLKALTICQPWAWAIVHDQKRVENRTWPARHRGPLALHAGKSDAWMLAGLETLATMGVHPRPDQVVFSAIVAVCELVDCVRVSTIRGRAYAEGPFCWILENVRALPEPIPCSGAQGLWRPSDDVLQAIARAFWSPPGEGRFAERVNVVPRESIEPRRRGRPVRVVVSGPKNHIRDTNPTTKVLAVRAWAGGGRQSRADRAQPAFPPDLKRRDRSLAPP